MVGFALLSRRPSFFAAEPRTPAERRVAAPRRARQCKLAEARLQPACMLAFLPANPCCADAPALQSAAT